MSDLLDRLSAERLRQRTPAFRWLWQHHDEVAAILDARAQKNRGSPIWSLLSGLSGGLSRHGLRQTWPVVDALWQTSDVTLRTALTDADTTLPAPVATVTPARSTGSVSAFSLPDITGQKI